MRRFTRRRGAGGGLDPSTVKSCRGINRQLLSGIFERDRSLTGKTYLWMLPIWGAGGLCLEQLRHALVAADAGWGLRGLAYVAAIYVIEYGSGWVLRAALGRCPWDYTGRGLHFRGLVRLDYAPAWFLCGLFFERVCAAATRAGLG